ncbi:MAG: hypothetical protein H0U67_14320, partial [Gemmatimonadetes bacterium]|nr:hypothetical protein [Gemmatimonadota bacterium]
LCTSRPIAVTGNHRFRKLSVNHSSCGITTDGELYCWGRNFRGSLGNGRPDSESTHIPQRVLDPA